MLKRTGDSLRNAQAIAIRTEPQTLSHSISGTDPGNVYRFRLKHHSSFQADLSSTGGTVAELIQDQNRNQRLDRGEVIARWGSDRPNQRRQTLDMDAGTYFVRVQPTGAGATDYNLVLSAIPTLPDRALGGIQSRGKSSGQIAAISKSNWNARFLKRDAGNVDDYRNYDFSRADLVQDLGKASKSRKTIARLDLDYGRGGPKGIGNDNFAMQASTTVRLSEGVFYQITSDSDDGARFLLKDNQTGASLTELDGDWVQSGRGSWSQIFTVDEGKQYDFYVQYYEKTGDAKVDVSLERVDPKGKVVASLLNVRNKPTTVNNTPVTTLRSGSTFTITKLAKSSDDPNFKDWYRIRFNNGRRGFVAAEDDFVVVDSKTGVISIGEPGLLPEKPPEQPVEKPPTNSGSPSPNSGVISQRVWITSDDKISIRSGSNVSASELSRVGAGTSLKVLETVVGSSYLNGYDLWYKVQFTSGGRSQEGYVAAYYVDFTGNQFIYPKAISKDNSSLKAQLAEINAPTGYSASYKPLIEEAAARYSWLRPSVIAGIGSRESHWGRLLSPAGPSGTGDLGHGRGLMQIDDRFHIPFINSGKWRDPRENIQYGINEVLAKNYDYLDRNTNLQGIELLRGALASYNAGLGNVLDAVSQGLDVDYYTTGQDYSADVLMRAGWFQLNGWS
jgi:hypothetical protein